MQATVQAPRLPAAPAKTPTMTADRRVYLDESRSTLVEEGSVDARWLLAPAGGAIPGDEVDRLGLAVDGGRVVQGAAVRPSAETASAIAGKMQTPEGDKMLRPDEQKGRGRK